MQGRWAGVWGESGDLDLGRAKRWAGQRDKGRGIRWAGGPATPPKPPRVLLQVSRLPEQQQPLGNRSFCPCWFCPSPRCPHGLTMVHFQPGAGEQTEDDPWANSQQ